MLALLHILPGILQYLKYEKYFPINAIRRMRRLYEIISSTTIVLRMFA
jgi:hypothetical protein